MWNKLLVVVFLIILANHVQAADWSEILKTKEKALYIDMDSMNLDTKNNTAKFWVKTKVAKGKGEKVNNIEVREYRNFYQINCKDRILSTISFTSYGDNNQILGSYSPVIPRWSDIIPDTLGDVFYRTVCLDLIQGVQQDPKYKLLMAFSEADKCFRGNLRLQRQLIFNREKLKIKIAEECFPNIKNVISLSIDYAEFVRGSSLTPIEREELVENVALKLEERIYENIDNP